jgi:hypothetical protein
MKFFEVSLLTFIFTSGLDNGTTSWLALLVHPKKYCSKILRARAFFYSNFNFRAIL